MNKIFTVLLFAISMAACNQSNDYQKITNNPDLYAYTVHELNQVVMGNNFSPIVASRNYAYAAIAGYEVVAAGNPSAYQSLAGQLKGLAQMPKPKDTANIDFPYAALVAYTTVGQAVTFPEGSMQDYTDSLRKLVKSNGMSSKMVEASEAFAKEVSTTIIAWSKKDNYAQTRSAERYTVKDSPGRWVPTPPMYASAAEPHWAEIRTMAIDSASQFRPSPPPAFNVTDKNS